MAKLPSEQDIGDLPDRMPRRMGVGGWQPSDLERGAQAIARGGEQLGMDLGRFAGEQKMLTNEAQTAQANAQATVGYIQNNQAITNSKDPDEVASLKQNYPVIAQSAAKLIDDPDTQQHFLLSHAPEVARGQVGADEHQQGLIKDGAIADFETNATNLTNAALSTRDPIQRQAAISSITQNGLSLVNRGIITQEQWAQRASQLASGYSVARKSAVIQRAEETGDTTELRQLSKEYGFSPGDWGLGGGGGGAAPATVMQQAILGQESGNNSKSPTSVDGAAGPGQILPATFAQYAKPGERIDNPADNRAVNGRILADYSQRYNGDPARIAVAYFSGPGNVAPPGSASPYVRDSKDGNGKSVSSYVSDVLGRVQRIQAATPNAGGAGGAGAPPRAIGDSVARGLGGVTGAMNAATSANPQQVLSIIKGEDVTTTHKDANGNTVTETAPGLKDADIKGPLVLSSGASNNPNSASLVGAQLAALKARHVDLSNVTVLGVGNRADFEKVGVNATLQKYAQQYGAKFQPLDLGMLSPDGVHPVAEGYKALASTIGGGGGPAPAGGGPAPAGGATVGGAPVIPASFIGVTPPGAVGANPTVAPPQSQWPADARGVEHNADGSISYVMSEGNRVPVPGSRATGAPGAPAARKTGTFLDALKPQENAEIGLELARAADRIESRRDAQNNQASKAAVADMTSRVQSLTSGRPITESEMDSMAPYAQSSDPGVRQAYAQMHSIWLNLARYNGKSPPLVAADVQQKEAEYNQIRADHPNDPRIETMGLILNAAETYSKNLSEQAPKAPIETAVKQGLLPNGTPALQPDDPNIEATIARRVADAKTAAGSLGVPVRYIQQSERSAFKDVARQGGEPMVDLAMHIVKSAGADAPAIFKEIGLDAPRFQKIGELAASGGDPEAIRDIASVINAQNDKATKGDVPTFTDKMLSKFVDPLQTAMSRFQIGSTARTRDAANLILSAEAQRNGYDPKVDPSLSNWKQQDFDRAYDLASGATFTPDGTKYGGIVQRRPPGFWQNTSPTLAPNTIKAADFPGVINSITDTDLKGLTNPPIGKNGSPISAAQIHGGLLEAVPDRDGLFRGKYAVFANGTRDPDYLVKDRSGNTWTLDLSDPKLDAALRARNNDSYLTARPAPATPAPDDRYKSTPGMIAISSEAETP